MQRAAVLTIIACAMFAVTNARVYDACEFAKTLTRFGVPGDQLSTWACIAYHESRFDTQARNWQTGDHGILQLSEVFWCGSGKACGVSCEALRDDDVSDDVQCALRVHAEHAILQGDGFMAWAVYSQHCGGNTKRYLTNC